jgi:hypothetical protein
MQLAICLKAATDNPGGTFTSAAAEAATAAHGVGEEVAASEAAAADPGGTFTVATVKAAKEEEEAPGGLETGEGVSRNVLDMWRMSEVCSATYDSCGACLAIQWSETLERAKVRGL